MYLIIVAKEGSVITIIKKNYNIFLYFIFLSFGYDGLK